MKREKDEKVLLAWRVAAIAVALIVLFAVAWDGPDITAEIDQLFSHSPVSDIQHQGPAHAGL